MSAGGLYAGEINCLVPSLLGGVRWLGVFARDELPDVGGEIRPWCLILNTDPKDKPGTHWLVLYASSDGPLEFFDSYGLPPSYYSLNSLEPLYLLYSFQSPSSSVCGHYCIVYVYLRSRNKSLSQMFHLLLNISNRDVWVKRYVHNLQNIFRILKPCHRTGQCCQLKCQFC